MPSWYPGGCPMSVIGDLLFTAVAFVFASFGVGLMRFGQMTTVPVRAMEAEEPTPVGDLSPGETVEVNGTVEPATEGTVPSPVYGDPAVEYVTKVQRRTSKGGNRGGWNTYHEEQASHPFVVSDETGEVRVEPPAETAPNVPMEWTRFGAGVDETLPDPVQSYLESVESASGDAGLDVGPLSLGSRQRVGEGTISPGDEIHVYGRVTQSDAGWDSPDETLTADDGTFLYTTIEPDVVTETTTKVGIAIFAFGLLWTAVTLFAGLTPWIF